ncbi:hypothetical protein SAMN05421837_107485 [Amycolatopsis pretoriensis]|uniref:Uncharacterized protein n=1 Tax=Amycolatopsis pretoriensis TaxID=218821 RepID=A0A1H5R8B2_9PSEU|nr:hypothetical protein [Amycolatopsis pretoriensis]SEF34626.1 hypothetical protein SAMN05421837_107485 [Amycolatopsis pretoriensis]
MRTLLGTGLLLLTLTACGAANTAAPAGSSTGPETPTTSASPVVPGSPTPPPPPSQTVGRPTQGIAPGDDVIAESQVDARGLPEGYPRSLTRSLDGKQVILQAEEGGCRRVAAHVGDQTPQQVVVLVSVIAAKKGQMCPDYIKEVSIPLTLAEPLGTRTVVLRQG